VSFGARCTQKVLYLHGPGSNEGMARRQVEAVFKNVPWEAEFKIFDWHFFIGNINQKLEEIHADPAVQEVFKSFGNKCGDTHDGYMSYMFMFGESHNDETWLLCT